MEAFVDHWESEPRTQEEWRQWYTGHRGFRADLSLVAVDQGTGEVAGFVLCAAYPNDWEVLPREAWINTVGTRREWRGKGLARGLLTEVLRRVADADDRLRAAPSSGWTRRTPPARSASTARWASKTCAPSTTMCRGPL